MRYTLGAVYIVLGFMLLFSSCQPWQAGLTPIFPTPTPPSDDAKKTALPRVPTIRVVNAMPIECEYQCNRSYQASFKEIGQRNCNPYNPPYFFFQYSIYTRPAPAPGQFTPNPNATCNTAILIATIEPYSPYVTCYLSIVGASLELSQGFDTACRIVKKRGYDEFVYYTVFVAHQAQ